MDYACVRSTSAAAIVARRSRLLSTMPNANLLYIPILITEIIIICMMNSYSIHVVHAIAFHHAANDHCYAPIYQTH